MVTVGANHHRYPIATHCNATTKGFAQPLRGGYSRYIGQDNRQRNGLPGCRGGPQSPQYGVRWVGSQSICDTGLMVAAFAHFLLCAIL